LAVRLFITLLAYHLVHTLRYQLKRQGIDLSWQSFRQIMSRQQRLTVTMPTQDKAQLFLRITREAETRQQKIYQALVMTADGLGKKKNTVENK
jgi:hypothetical protein